ncbi:MAG TPA: hypothetical protein VJW76_04825 [Verrucomicrobiae bacterium]|nr:hypothetical protein [Verrucomicrobiae bacterium]
MNTKNSDSIMASVFRDRANSVMHDGTPFSRSTVPTPGNPAAPKVLPAITAAPAPAVAARPIVSPTPKGSSTPKILATRKASPGANVSPASAGTPAPTTAPSPKVLPTPTAAPKPAVVPHPITSLRRKGAATRKAVATRKVSLPSTSGSQTSEDAPAPKVFSASNASPILVTSPFKHLLFDPWRLAGVLRKHWRWLVGGGGGLALLGFIMGWVASDTSYLASATLIRQDGTNGFPAAELGDVFRSKPLSDKAFRNFLRSPELRERVSQKSWRQVSANDLADRVRLSSEGNVEFVTVTLAGTNPQSAVDLANLFASEAVQMTKEMQAADLKVVVEHWQRRLKETEQAAKEEKELADLLSQFTTNHSKVKEVVAAGTKDSTNTRLEDLERARSLFQSRVREAEQFVGDAPGYCRVHAAANKSDVARSISKWGIAIPTLFGGFAGVCFAALAGLFDEISNRRTKTLDGVRRVIGLPVLAVLRDLRRMSRAVQVKAKWAHRTWPILLAKLGLHAPAAAAPRPRAHGASRR